MVLVTVARARKCTSHTYKCLKKQKQNCLVCDVLHLSKPPMSPGHGPACGHTRQRQCHIHDTHLRKTQTSRFMRNVQCCFGATTDYNLDKMSGLCICRQLDRLHIFGLSPHKLQTQAVKCANMGEFVECCLCSEGRLFQTCGVPINLSPPPTPHSCPYDCGVMIATRSI